MKQTTLDLNGPILGFSTHPQDVTVNNAGIATFIGIATAYFTSQNPTNIFSSNTGIVTHRWYAAGIGALSDGVNTTLGATLSGTATTTLTMSSVTSPTTNGVQLFSSADYLPSAYQSSSPITAGTGRSTGNAINEILFSNTATLTVNPFVSISGQPSSSTVAQGQTTTFSVTATSSNNTDVAYQWYIGGSPASNGTSGGNTISGANTNILTVTVTTSNYPCPGTKDMRGYDDSPADLNRFGLLYDYPIAKSLGFTDADIRCYLENVYLKIPGKSLGRLMIEILLDPTWGQIGSENSNVFVSVSHPTAGNSPVVSNTVTLSVVAARQIINVETFNQSSVDGFGAGGASLSSYNIFNGELTIESSPGAPQGTAFCFYAPERDVEVFIDLYASTGSNNGGYVAGQGGVSTIKMTLQQNVEYMISPLPQASGGAGVFLWRKASLIACCGGGGNAGNGGNGGDGGGVNVSGQNGSGRGAGAGARGISTGSLSTTSGIFGSLVGGTIPLASGDSNASGTSGGRALGCTKGGTSGFNSYWTNIGYSPCQDVGRTKLINANGQVVPASTDKIQRGHKVGYAIRQTAGKGLNGGGNGANGATGGDGGDGGGGGGGGSGYTDGSITVVTTRQGGNSGQPRVVIRKV